MRLKKIKLSGFKSFVESTVVSFPSQLVGVVGPNGCGKSNIIDAVRWVMGERSASELRGESMTDVIFNGSRDRKPLGQAFVELVFDNSEGRIVGEYAAYSEIAVKRLVTRDGQSNYFLNGAKCRRKDVIDVFLGTGVGSRGYSIIGQGTISRIIEAKPEDLRMFLEEAAGISKYKERRRETENRIRHTKDNLARINDIREELAKQLERLQRQSKAAEKYKVLKADERVYRLELEGLRWQDLESKKQDEVLLIQKQQATLEEVFAKQQQVATSLEKNRIDFDAQNDTYNEAQANVYRLASDIARLEETISHEKQKKIKLQETLKQAESDWASSMTHYEEYAQKVSVLETEIEDLKPLEAGLFQEVKTTTDTLHQLEQSQDDWQKNWQSYQSQASLTSEAAHRHQAEIQKLEHQLNKAEAHIQKLEEESTRIDVSSLKNQYQEVLTNYEQKNDLYEAKQNEVNTLSDRLQSQQSELKLFQDDVAETKSSLQAETANLHSLQTIQSSALGRDSTCEEEWLSKQNLEHAKRLAERLSVESGWELALERALGANLKAICVDDLNLLIDDLEGIKKGEFSFVSLQGETESFASHDACRLVDKVSSTLKVVSQLTKHIYCVDSLREAFDLLPKLADFEKIVTKDGILLGQGWINVLCEKDESKSLLLRERAIKDAKAKIEAKEKTLLEQNKQLSELAGRVKELEEHLKEERKQLTLLMNEHYELKSVMTIKDNQLKQAISRLEVITKEKDEEKAQIIHDTHQLEHVRKDWQQNMSLMEAHSDERNRLDKERETLTKSLQDVRIKLKELQSKYHESELSLKTKQSELELANDALIRENHLAQTLKSRIGELNKEQECLGSEDESILSSKLHETLTEHVRAEESLVAAKITLEDIKATQARLHKETEVLSSEQASQQQRLDKMRMDKQAIEVRQLTIEEALEKEDVLVSDVIQSLSEEANLADWQDNLEKVTTKISRLGAINLTAIEEFKVESERKTYLDEQCDDLNEALETLVAAINKIDKETRARFKETFEEVNQRFSQLFPRLFAGGSASLALTSEDWLDTGVAVMARPPGKRNSTIHLLSGGEKALTAVALVFAIFGLNPSPFCLLDEVDAPLDDSNVGRFCELVKEMSEKVQFVVITHNKVTMEMAEQLLGVTMHEPGVSRIVSVDVEKAYEMAT